MSCLEETIDCGYVDGMDERRADDGKLVRYLDDFDILSVCFFGLAVYFVKSKKAGEVQLFMLAEGPL